MNEKSNPKDPMAGLLRRTLRHDSSASPHAGTSGCAGPEILAAYYERSLEPSEASRWELHFSECAPCRKQLAFLAATEETAALAAGEPARSGAAWIWNWRWLAPLGAAAAALALWVAIRPAPPRTEAPSALPEQQVARSVPQAPPTEAQSGAKRAARGEDKPAPAQREAERLAKVQSGAAAEGALGKLRPSEPAAPAIAMDKKSEADEFAVRSAGVRRDQAALARDAVRQEEQKQAVNVAEAQKVPQSESPTGQPAAAGPSRGFGTAPVPLAKESAAGRMSANTVATLSLRATEEPIVVATSEPATRWRLLPDGVVARSDDGGATWREQPTPVKQRLVAGSAPSAKVCWLVGSAGTVLRTTDGEKWEKTTVPVEADLISVDARDALHARVTATGGRVYLTEDGGRTWKLQ